MNTWHKVVNGSHLAASPAHTLKPLLVIAAVIVCASATLAQSGNTQAPRTPHPILLPEANHLPDVNERMKMDEQNKKKLNFAAANAARKRQLDDDSTKLLLLAEDLHTKSMSHEPLPPLALREAEVIEKLAHDLKEKMKLTVGDGSD